MVAGASVVCSFGGAPANLNVTSQTTLFVDGKLAATIQDAAPIVNVPGCGMCTSLMNPQVQAATAAALGVLTAQPCVPAPAGMWTPTQTKAFAEGKPCLANDSKLMCAYGGQITVVNPGQTKGMI